MRSKAAKLIVWAIVVGILAELLRRLSERELATSEPPATAAAPESARAAAPESPPAAAQESGRASRAELYEEAKRRGIPGRSRMSKAELEQALSEGT
jgi:hypothetical protein